MKIFDKRPICNKDEASAPHICGKCWILCWRCTGASAGILITTIIVFTCNIALDIKKIIVGCMMAIPAILDFILGKFNVIKKRNANRFVTGIMLGIPIAFVVIYIFTQINIFIL